MASSERFAATSPLTSAKEKNAAIVWPLPIDHRLDQLKERVEASGQRTSRKELAAALVFAATTDAEKLGRFLVRYRKATVGAAYVGPVESDNIISIERRRPGPRPRRHSLDG